MTIFNPAFFDPTVFQAGPPPPPAPSLVFTVPREPAVFTVAREQTVFVVTREVAP